MPRSVIEAARDVYADMDPIRALLGDPPPGRSALDRMKPVDPDPRPRISAIREAA